MEILKWVVLLILFAILCFLPFIDDFIESVLFYRRRGTVINYSNVVDIKDFKVSKRSRDNREFIVLTVPSLAGKYKQLDNIRGREKFSDDQESDGNKDI